MHEFSICRSLVDSVLQEMDKPGLRRGRLLKVRMVAGALRQIVPDNLLLAYSVLIKDTPAEGSVLEIRSAPTTARCRKCGWTGEIEGIEFSCKVCGCNELEITGGKELFLDLLEIEPNEES